MCLCADVLHTSGGDKLQRLRRPLQAAGYRRTGLNAVSAVKCVLWCCAGCCACTAWADEPSPREARAGGLLGVLHCCVCFICSACPRAFGTLAMKTLLPLALITFGGGGAQTRRGPTANAAGVAGLEAVSARQDTGLPAEPEPPPNYQHPVDVAQVHEGSPHASCTPARPRTSSQMTVALLCNAAGLVGSGCGLFGLEPHHSSRLPMAPPAGLPAAPTPPCLAPDHHLQFQQLARRLVDFVGDYHRGLAARPPSRPVQPAVQPGFLSALLPDAPPEEPEPLEAVMRDLEEQIMPGITHWQSPSFFGWGGGARGRGARGRAAEVLARVWASAAPLPLPPSLCTPPGRPLARPTVMPAAGVQVL